MQQQQHVEDKEEVVSIPEDIIIRNSEKTNQLASVWLYIGPIKEICTLKIGFIFEDHCLLSKIHLLISGY